MADKLIEEFINNIIEYMLDNDICKTELECMVLLQSEFSNL